MGTDGRGYMSIEELGTTETTQNSPRRLSRLVLVFAASLISFSALSLLYVGRIASEEANHQAGVTERTLFENALKDRQSLIARDQLSVSRWDRAVKYITLKFREAFIEEEFVGSLWYDYGHERTFLIDPDGRIVLSAHEDRVDFTPRAADPAGDIAIIAHRAVERHQASRIAIAGGFSQKPVTSGDVDKIAEFSVAEIDGEPMIATAMAIVPDDEEVALPEGAPFIAISAKPIDRDLVEDLNSQLRFAGLTFSPDPSGKVPVLTASGKTIGSFDWQASEPGSHIWQVVVPVSILFSSLLALASLFVVRHIRRLSLRLEESEARNRALALRDPLSGLANRLSFGQALEAAAARATKARFAVLAGDLDRFKAINDTWGHAAGDRVIRTVAERLSSVVGDNGLVGRIGGDEFVILVHGFSDRARLSLLASQIMTAVGEPIRLENGVDADVGISLGIAVAPDDAVDATAIMATADRALYASKEGGRGRALFAADGGADAAQTAGDSHPETGLSARSGAVHAA